MTPIEVCCSASWATSASEITEAYNRRIPAFPNPSYLGLRELAFLSSSTFYNNKLYMLRKFEHATTSSLSFSFRIPGVTCPENGGPDWNRTSDTLLFRQVLYQLSYWPNCLRFLELKGQPCRHLSFRVLSSGLSNLSGLFCSIWTISWKPSAYRVCFFSVILLSEIVSSFVARGFIIPFGKFPLAEGV